MKHSYGFVHIRGNLMQEAKRKERSWKKTVPLAGPVRGTWQLWASFCQGRSDQNLPWGEIERGQQEQGQGSRKSLGRFRKGKFEEGQLASQGGLVSQRLEGTEAQQEWVPSVPGLAQDWGRSSSLRDTDTHSFLLLKNVRHLQLKIGGQLELSTQDAKWYCDANEIRTKNKTTGSSWTRHQKSQMVPFTL